MWLYAHLYIYVNPIKSIHATIIQKKKKLDKNILPIRLSRIINHGIATQITEHTILCTTLCILFQYSPSFIHTKKLNMSYHKLSVNYGMETEIWFQAFVPTITLISEAKQYPVTQITSNIIYITILYKRSGNKICICVKHNMLSKLRLKPRLRFWNYGLYVIMTQMPNNPFNILLVVNKTRYSVK